MQLEGTQIGIYNVPDNDHLQVTYTSDLDGVPPWKYGHLARPSVNTPLFTLRRDGPNLQTIPGVWPGGPDRPQFKVAVARGRR